MYIHVVNKGDVLWKIADYYNSSIPQIIEANDLKDINTLLVGESLVIPSNDYYLYRVRPGDTFWKIASRYNITVEEILLNNNNIDPQNLIVGTLINIPLSPKIEMEVMGYIYLLGKNAASVVNEAGDSLTYMSPSAYLINEDGSLQPINDGESIKAALDNNAIPIMSIINFTSTSAGDGLASKVLNNTDSVDSLIRNMLSVMKSKGYYGLNLDLENVLPEDKDAYNDFLSKVVDAFHKEGYFVTTALAPKVSADQKGLMYEAHDYEYHGKLADFVVLMTYEWGWRGGPPQAISPINKMKQVIEYALSVMPKEKIMMGFQIYARDWVLPHALGQYAETFSMEEAMNRARKYNAMIQYDEKTQSPYFYYTDEMGRKHEVWFEDARSAQAKFDLAKEYGLLGISYWALGYPFPQNWILLEDNFNIKKY